MAGRVCFFFSSRRRHTRLTCDWSSDVCSSDLASRGLDRIAALSDGVFAVALTLLVLDIRLPAGPVIDSDTALLGALGALGPRIVPYLLSFMTIGRSEERRVGKECRSRWATEP